MLQSKPALGSGEAAKLGVRTVPHAVASQGDFAALPFPALCWEPSWAEVLVSPPAAARLLLLPGVCDAVSGACRRPGKEEAWERIRRG